MERNDSARFTAFAGRKRIAAGDGEAVSAAVKKALGRKGNGSVLVFRDGTGEQVDFDGSGALAVRQEAARGVGRPKLGVVAREVTLLPRHWEWLNEQPGGASAALRRLVEEARKASAGKDRVRRAREAAHRFATAMAGNEPGFEEAMRALFAGRREDFARETGAWPDDVRDYARELAREAFGEGTGNRGE
jgi:hypothetical protein